MRRLLRLLPHHRADHDDRAATTGTGATAPTAARYRAERRAVARRLHPDLGGDVEQYLAALAEVDRRYGVAPAGGAGHGGTRDGHEPGASPARSRRSGLRRRVNRAARATRQRLPRRAPGSRRYASL